MKNIDEVFSQLARSDFRRRQRLNERDRDYLASKGHETILRHAAEFIAQRLAPAYPANDGKQTPWRGHPVFVAQHATATCCRGCLEKWHAIPKGRELADQEQRYIVEVIAKWLSKRMNSETKILGKEPELF